MRTKIGDCALEVMQEYGISFVGWGDAYALDEIRRRAECGRWIIIPGETFAEAKKHLRTTEKWKQHKRLFYCPVCVGA